MSELNPNAPEFVPSTTPTSPLATAFPLSRDWSHQQAQANTNSYQQLNNLAQSSAANSFANSFASGAASGLFGGLSFLGSGIVSSVLNSGVQNRALDLEYAKFDRSWKAANEAGLLSPDQFSTLPTGAGYYRSTGAGSILTKHPFAKSYSTFS
jgi:hypothetical protein